MIFEFLVFDEKLDRFVWIKHVGTPGKHFNVVHEFKEIAQTLGPQKQEVKSTISPKRP